jgi:glycosyltransferase involved in cell wall biosynthesis
VLESGLIGGTERVTAALAERLRTDGDDARVLFMKDAGSWAERLREVGVPFAEGGFSRPLPVRRYARLARELGADAAITSWTGAMAWGLRAGGYRGAVVPVEHGALMQVHTLSAGARARFLASRRLGTLAADAGVAVSETAAAAVHAAGAPRRLEVIHNGHPVDDRPAAARDRAPFTVLAAGRLVPSKGFDDLIEGFAAARHSGGIPHDARLVIAGDGPDAARLRALADDRGVTDALTLPGWVADMPAFWRKGDVAAVPSREWIEAGPLVAVEAMAAGLPIVGSERGGLVELVADGVSGALVAPGDPAAIGAALAAYAADPALRRAHGEAGRRHQREHNDIGACAAAYRALIAQLIEARAGR